MATGGVPSLLACVLEARSGGGARSSPRHRTPTSPRLAPRSWAADSPAHFYVHYSIADANARYLAIYGGLVGGFILLLLTRDTVFSLWAVR